MKVIGDRELIRKLNALGKSGRRVKRRGLAAGAKILLKAAKAEAPVKTGATRRALGQKRMKDDTVAVGVRNMADKKTGRRAAVYAFRVEKITGWYASMWSRQRRATAQNILVAIRTAVNETARR